MDQSLDSALNISERSKPIRRASSLGSTLPNQTLGSELNDSNHPQKRCQNVATNPFIPVLFDAFRGIGLHFAGVTEVAVKALELSYLAVIQRVTTTSAVRSTGLRARILPFLYTACFQRLRCSQENVAKNVARSRSGNRILDFVAIRGVSA